MSEAREELILAAERCMGELGPSVPLSDIMADAGQRNNSAVAYHFGNREGLIRAVIDRRTVALDQQRHEMLAEAPEQLDVGDLVRMLVQPMLWVPYAEGSTHFARFLEKLRDHPVVISSTFDDSQPALEQILERLFPTDLPTGPMLRRLRAIASTLFALTADAERDGLPTWEEADRRLASEDMVAMLVGMVTAPLPRADPGGSARE